MLAVLFAFNNAEARLNETLEQCIERYGNPEPGSGKDGEDHLFHKSGFDINIRFVNGKAVRIGYKKDGGGTELNYEAQNLEEINVGKVRWVPAEKIKVGGINTYFIDDENTKYAFDRPMMTNFIKTTQGNQRGNWVYLEFSTIEFFNELRRIREKKSDEKALDAQKRMEGL